MGAESWTIHPLYGAFQWIDDASEGEVNGMMRTNGEGAIGNGEMDAKSKKAMHSISLFKQYKELALTTRDAIKYLARRAEITLEHGEEELSGWSERKGDDLYQLINFYEKGAIKLKRLL